MPIFSEKWELLKLLTNRIEADSMAAYLQSSGIPVYVDYGALAIGIEGTYKVFVSAAMLEQARMATMPSEISDEELDFLATGERPEDLPPSTR